MRTILKVIILFWVLGLVASRSKAGEEWKSWVTLERFRTIVVQASKNVDLFQAVWEKEPQARFYGGTSRDFIWYVRGKLSEAATKQQCDRIILNLTTQPIQITEFVVGQSDVDIVTDNEQVLLTVEFDKSFLTRLEAISASWFLSGNEYYEQEGKQGYVGVEKLMLGKDGFVAPEGLNYGDGLKDIYSGLPSFHYDPRIAETKFFQEGTNHHVLLLLRYLRQVAMAYFRLYGRSYPDKERLLQLIGQSSLQHIRTIIKCIEQEGLERFIENDTFNHRINKVLDKAFRSYTNPNATKMLFEHFGLDRLLTRYDAIRNYHTLLYHKYRNEEDLKRHRGQLQEQGYLTTVKDYFASQGVKEHVLYHGTEGMDNYRSIVYQGNIVSSEDRSAGAGVYGVDERSKKFAEQWRGKDKTLVVKLDIDPRAKIVDISEGSGKKAFEEWQAKKGGLKWFFDGEPTSLKYRDEYEAFCDFVGADILRYEYSDNKNRTVYAYVVKNGATVVAQHGETIPLMTIRQIKAQIGTWSDERIVHHVELDPGILAYWDHLTEDIDIQRRADLINVILSGSEKLFELVSKHILFLKEKDEFKESIRLLDREKIQTLLWLSAKLNKPKYLEVLIEKGCRLDIKHEKGTTALMQAAENGHIEVVKTLIQAHSTIDKTNDAGATALLYATSRGHDEIVRILIQAGAQIDKKNNAGWTALNTAAFNGQDKVVRSLIQAGAEPDVKNNDGLTALMGASSQGHEKVVKALIEAKTNVDEKDNSGMTALMYAATSGRESVAELLIRAGAKIAGLNRSGLSALMLAAEVDNDGLVELLIRAGARVNQKGKSSWTALMSAANYGYHKPVEALIKAGADVDGKNSKGFTALMFAAMRGHDKVVEALVKAGANVRLTNKEGETAIHLALTHHHRKTARIMRVSGGFLSRCSRVFRWFLQ